MSNDTLERMLEEALELARVAQSWLAEPFLDGRYDANVLQWHREARLLRARAREMGIVATGEVTDGMHSVGPPRGEIE